MRHSLFPIATAILTAALLTPTPSLQAQASASTTSTKTTKAKARKHPIKKGPTVEEQIQSPRQDMQQQIQTLQQQLTTSQTQLQQAQAAAAAAQASAQQAQQQAAQQAQTLSDNTTAVSSLQGAVTDLKTTSSSLQTTVTDTQAKITKAIEHPDELHYKGITLSPRGSFIAAESVVRTRATGSDIPTPFTGVPLENQAQAKLSEFFATARQSRIALTATGKTDHATYTGYYEADWLGTGVTSNNNQSNSYVLRERVLWGQAALNNGLSFTAGQTWSLATEYRKGLMPKNENVPQTIDPNYVAGFVWARQYGLRVVQNFHDKYALGVSLEAPQTLGIAGSGTPTNFLIGSAGTGGGLYNSAGAPSPTGGASGNVASYSFNVAPDMILKFAADPGYGHYEVFGIARIFRDRVYPNITYVTTSYCVNSTTGIVTVSTTGCPAGTVTETTALSTTGTTAGAYNDKTVGGGIGGSFLIPATKRFDVGVKGLWGDGVSRYSASQIGDTTLRPDGQLALIHGFSAMGTI